MAPSGRFALALAFCVAVVVAATVGAISLSSDRDALQLDELLRIQQLPEGPPGSIDDHLGWTFEVFGGKQRWTEAVLSERFTSGFAEGFDAARLNTGLDQLFLDFGPVHFHRVTDRSSSTIRALAVAENGTPITIWLSVVEGGQIESLTLDEVQSPPRLPPSHAALALLAAWSFLAAALFASRVEHRVKAWVLLAAAPLATTAILILGESRAAYSSGRVLPPLLIPVATWLLTRSISPRASSAALTLGTAAAVTGMAAPLTRDSSLIAHPTLYGSVADAESVYRLLQALALGLAAAAFAAVVVSAISPIKRTPHGQRAHRWGVAGVAAAWGLAAVGSSIDYAIGDGEWAHGALAAVAASGLVLVPALAIAGMIASQWDRPGIARLVIDLEADGAQLDAAVAVALEDPTLQVLVSPDGHRLVTKAGTSFDPEGLEPFRSSTEIRSAERLVGALVHDASVRHEPERLQAVAAAAGLALEVERLNQQVTAQLEEVNASRSPRDIAAAGDMGRTREGRRFGVRCGRGR